MSQTDINLQQSELLRASWAEIAAQRDVFVTTFYQRLFALSPGIAQLFGNTDFQNQHTAFVISLIKIVDTFGDSAQVSGSVQGLALRHQRYAVRPEHYPIFGTALLETLARFLGERWTPEVRDAWTNAYDTISRIMISLEAKQQSES